MRNLILASLWDGTYGMAEPFLGSIAQSGFKGEVVMFVDGVSQSDALKMKAMGANVIPMAPFKRTEISGNGLRYRYYWEYLDKTPGYRNVMISDVRDVIVQRNPFEANINDELWCSLEDGTKIGENDWNRGWVEVIYGKEGLDRIKDQPISCSGATIGGFQAMYDYTLLMTKHLQQTSVKLGGIDQGVHNWLLYNGLLSRSRVFPNGAGPVLTLGLAAAKAKTNANNEFLNDDGSVAPVVHQWDRTGVGPTIRDKYRTLETTA